MAAQAWMDRRLRRLQPKDLGEGSYVHCLAPLAPPPGFEEVWTAASPEHELQLEELMAGSAVLLFADVREAAQAAALRAFVNMFDDLGPDAPPLLYVHHAADAASEETLGTTTPDKCTIEQAVVEFLKLGVDTAILEPYEGFRLAMQVRARLRSVAQMCADASAMLNEQRARNAQADALQRSIEHLIWSYALKKLAPNIFPAVDEGIGRGIPHVLDGYTFGQKLGSGSSGTVFELSGRSNGSVIKAIDKQSIGGFSGVGRFARGTRVLQALASSKWRHPNIIQLYKVYHSPTHFFFRMENGGPRNLHRRLKERPLSLAKAASVLQQLTLAVVHLHLGPGVCHMDIKPENFVLTEGSNGIKLKLTDFDSALFHQPGARCRSKGGTLPFVAPEVLLSDSFLPAPTDLWSLGLVMLEVLCGVGFLNHTIGMDAPVRRDDDFEESAVRFARKVQAFFLQLGQASRMLDEGAVIGGLGRLFAACGPALDGLLEVDVPRRWGH